jgi:hypothetical protein
MAWAKLDDRFHSNSKVRETLEKTEGAWAIALYTLALSHSAQEEKDGHVAPWFVKSVLPEEQSRTAAVNALIEAGLWRKNGNGWVIHDYLKYNPSRKEIEAKRAADAERKRRELKP